ncbi:hypothetical protein BH23CHL4_BH23CHL4_02770 [soil metagenome]
MESQLYRVDAAINERQQAAAGSQQSAVSSQQSAAGKSVIDP